MHIPPLTLQTLDRTPNIYAPHNTTLLSPLYPLLFRQGKIDVIETERCMIFGKVFVINAFTLAKEGKEKTCFYP